MMDVGSTAETSSRSLTPEAPVFWNVTQVSVSVFAPALPASATSLVLQRRRLDGGYETIATGLAGHSECTITRLEPATTYSFRFVAVGTRCHTLGPAALVTTAQPTRRAPLGLTQLQRGSSLYLGHLTDWSIPSNAVIVSVKNMSSYTYALAHGPSSTFITLKPQETVRGFAGMPVAGSWTAQVAGAPPFPLSLGTQIEWCVP